MSPLLRGACLAIVALIATGCASVPAPKYQPGVNNTELLYRQPVKIAVGPFTAAPGVENRSLGVRASALTGGSDGTFSTYLHDAVVSELKAAARFDPNGSLVLTGVLTQNQIDSAIPTGTATVAARFVLTRGSTMCFQKTLVAQHHWDSSFIGAVAIPAAMDNYPTTVQTLLTELFSDSAFISALNAPPSTP